MPITILSHQALVLPLKMRWPQRFSGLALCIGSMAPDLEFIGRMRHDWIFSHTVSAQLWFTVPVTMLLVWVVSALVIPALLPYLRDHPEWRLHDLAALRLPRSQRDWIQVAISAWVGGFSHVVLDGITHGNHSGWLVPWLPFLKMPVPHFGGPVPLHDALQLWLTIVLGIASVVMLRRMARHRLLWKWRREDVTTLPKMPRTAGMQLLVILALAAIPGGAIGHGMRDASDTKSIVAAVAFGAIDFVFLALVLSAVILRRRNSRALSFADSLSGQFVTTSGAPSNPV